MEEFMYASPDLAKLHEISYMLYISCLYDHGFNYPRALDAPWAKSFISSMYREQVSSSISSEADSIKCNYIPFPAYIFGEMKEELTHFHT